ncbi:MAG: hypothetical protein NT038_02780 [Euryarchaeota archaeon]|nr:hypothetical protein [Euryarchaeota archaeon]
MLKKLVISVCVGFVLLGMSLSGCLFFNQTTFILVSSFVVDDGGFAGLELTFNVSDQVMVTLMGPDNILVFSEKFYRGLNDVTPHLESYRKDPAPGTYLLSVSDMRQKLIFEKSFVFTGENLSVSRADSLWVEEHEGSKWLSFAGVNLIVENLGDLPVYPRTVEVTLKGTTLSSLVLPTVVLPGKQTTFSCFMYIKDLIPGEQSLDVVVKNKNRDVLAATSMVSIPQKNVSTISYTWDYLGIQHLILPDPGYLYTYYKSLERLNTEDYAAYVFDQFDDVYLNMVVGKLEQIFEDITGPVERLDAVASFVQSLQYAEDDPDNSSYEYPRYPLETLIDEQGDCEDKAVLTAALLDLMGYNVSLIRLPNHMAVGVHLDKNVVPEYSYYKDDFFYLETTRSNWRLGRVPLEYVGISNVTIHLIVPRPLLIHSWKNATRYTSVIGQEKTDSVKVVCIVENLGSKEADQIEISGVFVENQMYSYNEQIALIPLILPGEKEEVRLIVTIPQEVTTLLITKVFFDNIMVDEKESTATFP